jgi:hypothetical protein
MTRLKLAFFSLAVAGGDWLLVVWYYTMHVSFLLALGCKNKQATMMHGPQKKEINMIATFYVPTGYLAKNRESHFADFYGISS